jgi:glycerophosphoryl diester phosphodiesterase
MKTVSLFPGLPRPLLFGHRGCSYAAPENTMQAIELCVMHRIPAVEIDIHLTLDGKLVLTHDFNIKRVSGIDAVIEKTTWDT